MLQSEVFPYYRKCVEQMNLIYDYLKSIFEDGYVDELCTIRGYVGNEQKQLISDMQLGICTVEDITELGDMSEELGLITSTHDFLLNNRFIIPVEDIQGNIVSMIGYYNDYKKYITIPSPFFSKSVQFFNFKQAYELSHKEYGGFVILVEGIFDCLSLRSIGLPAIATMGSNVTKTKCELLKLFKKVLAIPDDDATGRKALNRYSKYGWNVPYNTTFLKFNGGYMNFNGIKLHCKDMDNFVSWYDAEDVRDILLSYRDSKEDIEELVL